MADSTYPERSGAGNSNWRGGAERPCAQCGKIIWVKPSDQTTPNRFCSRPCFHEFNRKFIGTPDHPSWRGGPITLTCQVCPVVFSVSRAEFERRETRFCSRTCWGVGTSGANHPNWVGGKEFRANFHAKMKDDPAYRLRRRFGRAIRRSVIAGKGGRSITKILGYTLAELVAHLETTMPIGSNWADFHAGRLHVDHIVPIKSFAYTTIDDPEFKACWALSNLQLLTADHNRQKNAKLNWQPPD
jgi:hypothetical protein